MKVERLNEFGIIPPKKSAFIYETPRDEIKLHTLCLACGGRGSGKTVAIMSKLKDLHDAGFCDRLFILSPTAASNQSIYDRVKHLDSDVYNNPTRESLLSIIQEIEQEATEWNDFLVKQKKWRKAMRVLGRRQNDPFSPDFLTSNALSESGDLEEPKSKYGHRPCIHLLIDDCQGTPVFSTSHKSPFVNLCLRHRHVGKGLGVSLWIACQTYKSQGGLPRSVRENCTHLLLFRTKNLKSIQQIGEEIGDVVGLTEFHRAYRYATKDAHSFLFIDFSPKDPKYRFRKRFDTLILFGAEDTDGQRDC
jgi:hypothetical protein